MRHTRDDHDEKEEFGVTDEQSQTDIAMTGHPITFGLFNVLFRQVLGSRTNHYRKHTGMWYYCEHRFISTPPHKIVQNPPLI